jgi:hypothetical protein
VVVPQATLGTGVGAVDLRCKRKKKSRVAVLRCAFDEVLEEVAVGLALLVVGGCDGSVGPAKRKRMEQK